MDPTGYLILLTVSFFAMIMGTLVGMAMIVLLPVMIFLGVPVHTAIATGRFSMLGGNVGTLATFTRQGRIHRKYILAFGIAGAFGALSGAYVLQYIGEQALMMMIGVFMILISLVIFFENGIKAFISKHHAAGPSFRHHALSALAGLFIGSYIGIIGGGGATLVIFCLVLIYGLNFHDAVANQKAITLPISIVATIVFIIQGAIDYSLAIPLLLVNLLGGIIGAQLIMKVSTVWIKRILVPITIILGIKLIFFP